MEFRNALSALLLSATVIASPAGAATYLITYTGHVTSGYDHTGVFGTAGANLAGLAFTAVYTLTIPTPGALGSNNGTSAYMFGGTIYDAPSPVSGEIRFGDTVFSDLGARFSFTEQTNGLANPSYGFDYIYQETENRSSNSQMSSGTHIHNFLYSQSNDIVDSSYFLNNFNYTVRSEDNSFGYFETFIYDNLASRYLTYAYADLSNDHVTIAEISAVPEPASWLMMILGFGLAGGAMRRRTHLTVTYA